MQVLILGRAPRTKETLPDFLKWRRVTRPPFVFRGLTGSQRTPGFWGVTYWITYREQILKGWAIRSIFQSLKAIAWCSTHSIQKKYHSYGDKFKSEKVYNLSQPMYFTWIKPMF